MGCASPAEGLSIGNQQSQIINAAGGNQQAKSQIINSRPCPGGTIENSPALPAPGNRFPSTAQPAP
jgi:hypothetical protein